MSTTTDTRGRHGSIRRTYHYNGERGGYSLVRSKRGWIVEFWSRESGSVSGRRVLVPYTLVRSGIDPDAAINDYTSYAGLLAEYTKAPDVKVLRRGHVVR